MKSVLTTKCVEGLQRIVGLISNAATRFGESVLTTSKRVRGLWSFGGSLSTNEKRLGGLQRYEESV